MKNEIIHEINGYYVTNEGTKRNPNYHVWKPGLTHAYVDSAYSDESLAICRCNYLARRDEELIKKDLVISKISNVLSSRLIETQTKTILQIDSIINEYKQSNK